MLNGCVMTTARRLPPPNLPSRVRAPSPPKVPSPPAEKEVSEVVISTTPEEAPTPEPMLDLGALAGPPSERDDAGQTRLLVRTKLAVMMRDLPFFETAIEGAGFCVASIHKIIPSRAALAMLPDETGRLTVAYAAGEGVDSLVKSTAPRGDWAVAAAEFARRPVHIRAEGLRLPDRHARFGATSVVVAPVLDDGGNVVAVIEIIEPEIEVSRRLLDALDYVADRFSEFLHDHRHRGGELLCAAAITFDDQSDPDARAPDTCRKPPSAALSTERRPPRASIDTIPDAVDWDSAVTVVNLPS